MTTKIKAGVIAAGAVDASALSDNSITIAHLNCSDGTNGQVLSTDGSGTLSFADVGIDGIVSSADATAITIDSSENVTFEGGVKVKSTNKLSFSDTSDQTYIHAAESNVLAFGTNSTERMRIDSSGNVGIGTSPSNPSKKLDVYQSTVGTGAADFRHVNGNRILLNPSYNYYDAYNHIFRGLNGTSTHMTIDNSGNVGIGADSPSNRLHIEGPASAHTALQIETTTSGFDPTIHFVSPANNSGIYVDDNDTNKMKFYNGYGKGAAGKEITFDNNGNVGIGTTNPAEKLNIDSGSLRIDATYGVGAPGFQVMKIVDKNNPTYGWVTNLETSLTGDLHLGRLVNGTRSDVMVFSRANGDVSFNGGVVKGARQTINHQGTTNEVTVSGNTYNTTMTSLNVTTTGNSKLLIWAHSGQILKPYDNANPQMRIEVNGTFIGSAHDGNHYWYATAGANSTSARVWLTNFGASGTLSAGTHTIRLVAGAYGAGHTFNYQNQNCHMVIMEVGA